MIYFRNKFPNQVKNSNTARNVKIKVDDFWKRKKKKKKKKVKNTDFKRIFFGNYWMKLTEFDQYVDNIKSVCVLCKDSFFFLKVDVRR